MFSVPCLRLLCHFLPPVVFVVSLYLILFSLLVSGIYSPSVSLVLCELLNVMVVCLPVILFFVPFGFWLIVCSSFSMKYLHIDPCLSLFSPASPQHQLAGLFTSIFNESLATSVIPTSFKKSVIIPVPKNSKPSCLNDYRPVALTSTVMKVFERLLKKHICSSIPATLDPSSVCLSPK